MSWIDQALARLATHGSCGYRVEGTPSTEPTALAALALLGHGWPKEARSALAWLAHFQAADGSLGVTSVERTPCWPTALTVLAWRASALPFPVVDDRSEGLRATAVPASNDPSAPFDDSIDRALNFMLHAAGEKVPRSEDLSHDSTLIGWSWVPGTHSWVEPTAWHLLALASVGQRSHPRARQAVDLLLDRLLPSGGWNYGNTLVFGQELRPHVQPTGLTLLALAGEPAAAGRLDRSLDYLERELSAGTTAASLSYGLLGLAAHDRFPRHAATWLNLAYGRVVRRDASPLKLALLALAALGSSAPLPPFTQRQVVLH